MSRVLVIGGYGGFGARLSRRLAARNWTVLVAGRNAEAARTFCATLPGAEPVALDRNALSAGQLRALQADLVIDAAGPFQGSGTQVISACIDAGIAYVDLADSRDFVTEIGAMDALARRAGVPVVSGASSVPGLSGAVIRHLTLGMERVCSIDMFISASNRATAGPSVAAAVLSYVGKPVRLWRGGCFVQRTGWQMLRRQTFAIAGLPPLRRLTALADVPDHDLVPDAVPGRPATTFRAGTEFRLHVLALWLLSWPVKWGWLTSLSKLRSAMLKLQRLTSGLGTDRSAMSVEAKGFASGTSVLRRWTLIAADGDGPEIPTMAAELIVGMIREQACPPGAYHAGTLLDLAQFSPLFGALAIRQAVTEQTYPSLYRRILGERFDDLPSLVRTMHEVVGDAGAFGSAMVTRGSSVLARFICKVMGFPPAGTSDLHVAFEEHDGVETWTRRFADHVFSSELSQSGELLVERFGPMRFFFELVTSPSGIEMVLRRWSLLRIPMPLVLGPICTGSERIDGDAFAFDVSVALPLVGLVVRYAGSLRPAGPHPNPLPQAGEGAVRAR